MYSEANISGDNCPTTIEKWFVTHSSLEEGSLIVVSVGVGGDNAGCSGIGLASLSKFSDYIG